MEQPRGFSDVFSNRATHSITIYQQILICQETIGTRLSCAIYWTRSSGFTPDEIEQYLEAEVRGDYEGLLRLATGKNTFGGHPLLPAVADPFQVVIQGVALIA